MSAGAYRTTCILMGPAPAASERAIGSQPRGVSESAGSRAAGPLASLAETSEPAAPPPAEAELLRRALEGDDSSWSLLITRHNRKVVVALLARGASIEQAKDLAQETWLRLIESQRACRLSSLSLPGLAIVQAGYLLRNVQRSDGRVTSRPRDASGDKAEGSAASADPAPLPEELLVHRDRVARVAGALSSCPPSARRVFEFVYDHPELPYTEVAARFRLSTQRIKQMVCEVRKRLRAALMDEEA